MTARVSFLLLGFLFLAGHAKADKLQSGWENYCSSLMIGRNVVRGHLQVAATSLADAMKQKGTTRLRVCRQMESSLREAQAYYGGLVEGSRAFGSHLHEDINSMPKVISGFDSILFSDVVADCETGSGTKASAVLARVRQEAFQNNFDRVRTACGEHGDKRPAWFKE